MQNAATDGLFRFEGVGSEVPRGGFTKGKSRSIASSEWVKNRERAFDPVFVVRVGPRDRVQDARRRDVS